MEKYVVFGPIVLFFGFFFLLVIGFFALVGKLITQGRNQSWRGTVIEKVVFEKEHDDSHRKEHILSLKVRLENGETHSIPASVDFYNSVSVGDRLEKSKGSLWPKKI